MAKKWRNYGVIKVCVAHLPELQNLLKRLTAISKHIIRNKTTRPSFAGGINYFAYFSKITINIYDLRIAIIIDKDFERVHQLQI